MKSRLAGPIMCLRTAEVAPSPSLRRSALPLNLILRNNRRCLTQRESVHPLSSSQTVTSSTSGTMAMTMPVSSTRSFPARDLERLVEMRATSKPLATMEIPEYYLRQGENRQVRPYQQEAMQALDHAVELGKHRFLIELPTGTGKTDAICLYLKRLIEAGRAERILFLVGPGTTCQTGP